MIAPTWRFPVYLYAGAAHAGPPLTINTAILPCTSPERLRLLIDRARVVAQQIFLMSLRHRVAVRWRVWIALHPVKRQFADGLGPRRVDVHIFAEAVGVYEKSALPSFRQGGQAPRVEIDLHLVAVARD